MEINHMYPKPFINRKIMTVDRHTPLGNAIAALDTSEDHCLYGEFGSPATSNMGPAERVVRWHKIDQLKISHKITNLRVVEDPSNTTITVSGDITPTGPFGKLLKDILEDNIEDAFKARVITTPLKDKPNKRVAQLITFDVD